MIRKCKNHGKLFLNRKIHAFTAPFHGQTVLIRYAMRSLQSLSHLGPRLLSSFIKHRTDKHCSLRI